MSSLPKPRTKGKSDVYEIVTDKILSLLDLGIVPWHKPWRGGAGHPCNLKSKKPYRGINPFLLMCESMDKGYSSPYWLSFKQAKDAGGCVRKGEKSSLVVFWKWLEKEEISDTGEHTKKRIPLLRYYRVFNVEQCDGIDYPKPETDGEALDFEPISACESIVSGFATCPPIKHGGFQAFYRPSEDSIGMPEKETFESVPEYYSTLFHEMTHSTGHESRLGRHKKQPLAAFGSSDYGKEELVAEMGAAFLCGVAGIEPATIENSAAYVENWRKAIKGDKKLVVTAAAQAQKSSDFIQGITFGD